MIGRVFDIQRFCVHDGPGIRTTVFLKGSPLRCLWCHNPEGLSPHPELSFLADRCLACGACLSSCPQGAHELSPNAGHRIARDRCRACGACAAVCPAGALEMVGQDMTVQQVLAEALRDRAFYRAAGGGITLSGGEPLLQPRFAAAVLQAAKAESLHTAIETCGAGGEEQWVGLLPYADRVLFDLKETEPQRHRQYTGAPLPPEPSD